MILSSIYNFYNIWIKDLFQFGIIQKPISRNKRRIDVKSNTIYIGLHEWGGYNGVRRKYLKKIVPFEVGLDYQLKRFYDYRGPYNLDIYVTMSDIHLRNDIKDIEKKCAKIISVSNVGMDFSGYSTFYDNIKHMPNSYVILTNSSVNKDSEDCIDSMIRYLDDNKDVGMLGASSSSCYYHTLLRWNFNPHLQSFFLLTTIDVLREVVTKNNGLFPGVNETNKHLLIRNGEVKLSKLILGLGYNLAVANEHGVFKFNDLSYPLPKGDYRHFTNTPNKLYSIK